jgi:hypothetical protein
MPPSTSTLESWELGSSASLTVGSWELRVGSWYPLRRRVLGIDLNLTATNQETFAEVEFGNVDITTEIDFVAVNIASR